MDKELANLTQRLTVIENDLNRIDHVVNGNGQPGLAHKIEKLITQISLLMQRLDHLEESAKNKKLDWQWLITAVIAAAALLTNFIK